MLQPSQAAPPGDSKIRTVIAIWEHHELGTEQTGRLLRVVGANLITAAEHDQSRRLDGLNFLWPQLSSFGRLLRHFSNQFYCTNPRAATGQFTSTSSPRMPTT